MTPHHRINQSFIHSFIHLLNPTEKDLVVELLPMVIGQRSAYTEEFVAFLNETKKEKEMITADQVGGWVGGWMDEGMDGCVSVRRSGLVCVCVYTQRGSRGSMIRFDQLSIPSLTTTLMTSPKQTPSIPPPPLHLNDYPRPPLPKKTQWNQFYDFSLAYPTVDVLLKQSSYEEDSSCKFMYIYRGWMLCCECILTH